MAYFPKYVSAAPVFIIDPLISVLRVSNGARTFIIRISEVSKEILTESLKDGYVLNVNVRKSHKIYTSKPNVNESMDIAAGKGVFIPRVLFFHASYATMTLVHDNFPPKIINGIATTADTLAITDITQYSEEYFDNQLKYFYNITYGARSRSHLG